MSMIGYCVAVSSEQGEVLIRDPASMAPFVTAAVEDQDELGADFVDIDKSWHAIHFLLTAVVAGDETPWEWVVHAPRSIDDASDPLARVLAPDQVVEVSKALAPLTGDKLKRKCDLRVLTEREIYPGGWRLGDEDYIAENFNQLRKLYESAARRRMAIVQWIARS